MGDGHDPGGPGEFQGQTECWLGKDGEGEEIHL